MQLYRLIYYSQSALHVSGDVFAHHQVHPTVFTASGNVHKCRYRLVSWMSWNSVPTHPPHRPKHVELTRNNRLTYKFASRWLYLQLYHDARAHKRQVQPQYQICRVVVNANASRQ